MTYDRRHIMLKAWSTHTRKGLPFHEALRRAWLSEKSRALNDALIARAKKEAGITEDVNTWYRWKELGFEVVHGSKALFQTDLVQNSHDNVKLYRASFFGTSQVRPTS